MFIFIQDMVVLKNCCYLNYNGGRTGNVLTQYIFARVFIAKYNLSYTNGPRMWLPFPFNYTNKTGRAFLPSSFASEISGEIYLKFGTILSKEMNMPTYFGRKKQIKELLNIPTWNTIKYDVVVHIRLDDIFYDHAYYTLLPLSFYKEVFSNIKKPKSICLVGKPLDDQQFTLLKDIQQFIFNQTQVMPFIQTGSVEEDFETFMSAPVFVASTSSFWFWPVFVSDVTKEVHFPLFGQTRFMGLTKTMKDEQRIYYAYELPISTKIKQNELNLFYDV